MIYLLLQLGLLLAGSALLFFGLGFGYSYFFHRQVVVDKVETQVEPEHRLESLQKIIDNLRTENELVLMALVEAKNTVVSAPAAPNASTPHALPPEPPADWEPPIDWQPEYDEKEVLRHSVVDLRNALQEKERAINELADQIGELETKLDPTLIGPDNLQLINGIGPYIEKMLHQEFGIHSFERLAKMTSSEIEALSKRLFFHDKIQRENWVGQAAALYEKKYGRTI